MKQTHRFKVNKLIRDKFLTLCDHLGDLLEVILALIKSLWNEIYRYPASS